MTKLSSRIEEIKERLSKATPGPWGPYSANIPFNATVTKPAPSLSKYDDEQPTFWRCEDAVFIARAHPDLTFLLAVVEEMSQALDKADWGLNELTRIIRDHADIDVNIDGIDVARLALDEAERLAGEG